MTRIGSAPTTDPNWMDQKINNNQELTTDEAKIADRQTEILGETLQTLNQPVQKGDIKAAKARVDHLEETFKNLSTEDKQYMYNVLTSKSGLAEKLEYKLSAFSREKLLKTLNPDHSTSQNVKNKISEEAKASQKTELKTLGTARQTELQKSLDFPSVPLGGRDFQSKIKDSEIPSVPLGGKDFQNKIKDSEIPSIPLGGEDFKKRFPTEEKFPSIPLGGKDSNDSEIPSIPLGGEDFKKRFPTEPEFPSIPLGGSDFDKKIPEDSGIPSVPLGGNKIDK